MSAVIQKGGAIIQIVLPGRLVYLPVGMGHDNAELGSVPKDVVDGFDTGGVHLGFTASRAARQITSAGELPQGSQTTIHESKSLSYRVIVH